jgi:hypothetical protein
MRRVLGMLMLAAWLALVGVVITAIPASASPGGGNCVSTERRNVGGTGPAACTCAPGLGERRNVGGTGPAACGCIPSMFERRNVGGTGPTACTCIPSLFERRNVGGTGPADGTCPPGLSFGWWQFPRFR